MLLSRASPEKRAEVEVRFLAKAIPEPNTGCWLWCGKVNKEGYGRLGALKQMCLAHRVSYVLFVGPIADGLCVLHRCDVPGCVNPDHLFLGTLADNNLDKVSKGRQPRGQDSGGARLTDFEVRVIKDLLSLNKPAKHVARLFGVHDKTIRGIRNGAYWGHLSMSQGRCVDCGDTASVKDVHNNFDYCWRCYIASPIPTDSFYFPEPGSEMEIAVVPRCHHCQVELVPALDCVWSDEESADLCFRCRRDPNREVTPF